MRNLSNEFCMQFHFHANQSYFHKNGFAVRLALKQSHKGTRKWPINRCIDLNNNKTDSTNTCEHLCPLHCAEMYPEVLARTTAAILDKNESPINDPRSSGQKRQNAGIPHIYGTQKAANIVIKPH